MSKTKTTYYSELVDTKTAKCAYDFIKDNTQWVNSIYSKRAQKITRKGYSVNSDLNNNSIVDEFVIQLVDSAITNIEKIENRKQSDILGIYLNYYINGQDFCPNHSHPGSIQLVISLGATRRLNVGKKAYDMKSGDAIIFGSSTHGIPIEPEVKDGRISIAVFISKRI
jgi:hypothetical protein